MPKTAGSFMPKNDNPCWMGVSDGQAAFTLVLHTWSQELGLHVHLHAIMACGVGIPEQRDQ